MRRTFSQIVVSLVVIALAGPAATAVAGQEMGPRQAAPSSSTVSINTAIARAVTANRASEQAPIASKAKVRGIRMQGKGAMITGIVYTVVGLAGTVYMIKYMQDQQKKSAAESTLARIR